MSLQKSFPISLFLLSLIAGFLLAAHFHISSTARPDDPIGQLRDQEKIAEQLVTEQADLKNQILTLREEIDTLSAKNSSADTRQLLETLNQEIGLTATQGRGVIIRLAPPSDSAHLSADDFALYSANLRDLIQRLWAGGATAISLNGQRIIALSPVTFVGNSILINDSRTVPPFEIIALGDPQILAQELDLERYLPSLSAQVSAGFVDFSVLAAESLSVPVYSGRLSTTYLQPTHD